MYTCIRKIMQSRFTCSNVGKCTHMPTYVFANANKSILYNQTYIETIYAVYVQMPIRKSHVNWNLYQMQPELSIHSTMLTSHSHLFFLHFPPAIVWFHSAHHRRSIWLTCKPHDQQHELFHEPGCRTGV